MGKNVTGVAQYFISVDNAYDMENYVADGIFGLGFYMADYDGQQFNNNINQMYEKKLIPARMFSFQFSNRIKSNNQVQHSVLSLGEHNQYVKDHGLIQDIRYIEVADPQYWGIRISSLKFSSNQLVEGLEIDLIENQQNRSVNQNHIAIIDTGTSITILPQVVFE